MSNEYHLCYLRWISYWIHCTNLPSLQVKFCGYLLPYSPGEGNGNPLQYPCQENPMDRAAWVGYTPWGRKESDTTERLRFHLPYQLEICSKMIGVVQQYEWHRTFVLHRYRFMTTPKSLEYIHIYTYYIYTVLLLSCVQLFATSWTVAHQGPLPTGILQARILEWVAMSSGRSSQPRD